MAYTRCWHCLEEFKAQEKRDQFRDPTGVQALVHPGCYERAVIASLELLRWPSEPRGQHYV